MGLTVDGMFVLPRQVSCKTPKSASNASSKLLLPAQEQCHGDNAKVALKGALVTSDAAILGGMGRCSREGGGVNSAGLMATLTAGS